MLHILFVSYFDQCFQDIEHKDLGMVSFPQCFIHFTVHFIRIQQLAREFLDQEVVAVWQYKCDVLHPKLAIK
jgi:hypothetical protein